MHGGVGEAEASDYRVAAARPGAPVSQPLARLIAPVAAALGACILPMILASTAAAHDEVEAERKRVFMPALEVGAVFHADPSIRVGPVFRTAIDYRIQRLRAGFFRAAYDATTARIDRTVDPDAPKLIATGAFHDLLLVPRARSRWRDDPSGFG